MYGKQKKNIYLLSGQAIVFQKSRVSKIVQKNNSSWDIIADKYWEATGKVVSILQLNKLLQM